MTSDSRQFDPRLIELHLGHLAPGEELELRRRIAEDPALAAQDAGLAAVLRALDAAAVRPAPADLTARVMARVHSAGPVPALRVVRPVNGTTVRPADGLTAAVERGGRTRIVRLGNLRDIVAVAAMIVLAVGVGMPGLMHMRERSQRLGCSWNLAQLGRGVQQYAATFNASLPFAGWTDNGGASWWPRSEPNVVTIPNRRHVYPLLQLAYVVDPRLFVCPGQRGVPMPREAVARHRDFLEARNVNYAYQNMAGVRPSARDDARLPIMSDENPLFDEGAPLFDPRRWKAPAQANSRAHGGAGQNLLTLGGEVRWVTTPLAGVGGDNIWTLEGVQEYTGHEGPLAATDAHLLK